MREPLAMILAVARNGCIGRGAGLPWHLPEDLEHLKRATRGHAVIMGRKTYEAVGRPLPQRRNLIVTRKKDYRAEGCEVYASLSEAIAAARTTDPMPFILGGAEIYRSALADATRIYLTEVDLAAEGDTFFVFDRTGWRETERRTGAKDPVTFITLERE